MDDKEQNSGCERFALNDHFNSTDFDLEWWILILNVGKSPFDVRQVEVHNESRAVMMDIIFSSMQFTIGSK